MLYNIFFVLKICVNLRRNITLSIKDMELSQILCKIEHSDMYAPEAEGGYLGLIFIGVITLAFVAIYFYLKKRRKDRGVDYKENTYTHASILGNIIRVLAIPVNFFAIILIINAFNLKDFAAFFLFAAGAVNCIIFCGFAMCVDAADLYLKNHR